MMIIVFTGFRISLPICISKNKYFSVVLPYGSLLRRPNFKETESFMEEYARLIGPLAKEIILYRTP